MLDKKRQAELRAVGIARSLSNENLKALGYLMDADAIFTAADMYEIVLQEVRRRGIDWREHE